jgi:Uma2 family endonuclease
MDAILEKVLQSPRLRLFQEEIDRTLRAEQEARQKFYDGLTEDGRAEFINGKVIVQSPAKNKHIVAVKLFVKLLDSYVQIHDLGFVGPEQCLVSLTRNDYEPDICFWPKSVAGNFTKDQMKFPPPLFVVEVISPSTEVIDRGVKFDDYAAHGVAEYWIVDPDALTVEQYLLREGKYELACKASSGAIRSAIVSGFEIAVAAIFDPAQNLAALRKLIAP